LPIPAGEERDAATPNELALTRFVPMRMKRRGVEMRLIIDGGAGPAARVDLPLLKATARAYRWSDDLVSGRVRSIGEIAKRERLTGRYVCPTWGQGASAPADVRAGERQLETVVSAYIGSMPFLCLGVEDDPGPDSLRGFIERNAIGLLSNYHRSQLDPPSSSWLGRSSSRERVRASGLWNSNHVDEQYDSKFLDAMEHLTQKTND
jgi:hypothetical protein